MLIYTACYDVVALYVALHCYPWVTVGEGDAAWRSCGRPAPKIRPSPLVVDADRYLCLARSNYLLRLGLARSNYLLSLGIRLGLAGVSSFTSACLCRLLGPEVASAKGASVPFPFVSLANFRLHG